MIYGYNIIYHILTYLSLVHDIAFFLQTHFGTYIVHNVLTSSPDSLGQLLHGSILGNIKPLFTLSIIIHAL